VKDFIKILYLRVLFLPSGILTGHCPHFSKNNSAVWPQHFSSSSIVWHNYLHHKHIRHKIVTAAFKRSLYKYYPRMNKFLRTLYKSEWEFKEPEKSSTSSSSITSYALIDLFGLLLTVSSMSSKPSSFIWSIIQHYFWYPVALHSFYTSWPNWIVS
jgi:hypothetical protein